MPCKAMRIVNWIDSLHNETIIIPVIIISVDCPLEVILEWTLTDIAN